MSSGVESFWYQIFEVGRERYMPQSLSVTGLSHCISTVEGTSVPWEQALLHKSNRVCVCKSHPKSTYCCSSSREEDSDDRHNTVRNINKAYSWFVFSPGFLFHLCHKTRHVTDKSCQKSANCWERWQPKVILRHFILILSTSSSP